MAPSTEAPDSTARATNARWPTFILLAALLVGLCAAGWGMARRGVPDGPRDLTVLAPQGARVSVDGATSRIPVAEDVHAFSVTPGAHRLALRLGEGPALERELTVPPGIGPLMIAIHPGSDGALEIGFY